MPPSGCWHITLQVRGQSKRVKQLFQKNNQCLIMCIYSCGKCFVHVPTCLHGTESSTVCVCVCMFVSTSVL